MSGFPQLLTADQTSKEVPVNENFQSVAHAGCYAKNPATSSGLTWGYFGGRWGGNSIADGTFTLTDASANYIVVARSNGATTCSTATTNWNDTANYARVYKITTVWGAVSGTPEDHRAGPFGVHGQSGGSPGDVLGPGSSTADHIAQFSGTTGKLLKDGLAFDASSSLGTSNTTVPSQGAVKSYVDAAIAGLSWKQAVRAATTAAGTLASSFANGQVVDGVTLATGDRVLIKNQATGSENGIYVVAASGAPARASDADSGAELVNASVYVSEGTTLADTQWTCTTNSTITVGSTSLAFAQLTSGGGSGTVTSVDASGGVETASGSAITATGTIRGATTVNAQSGTTYTYVTGDRGALVTHTNASAIAGTLPQAGTTGFETKWYLWVQNRGAGTLTITPTTSTIDGATSLALTTGQGCLVVSDGTNYFTMRGIGGAGGGSTQGLHDISLPAGSWYADATSGPLWGDMNGATDQPDGAFWGFDPTTEQAIWTCVVLPKSYDLGTVTAVVRWTHPATTTNFGVAWQVRAVALGDTEALATNYGTGQIVTDTGGTTDTIYQSAATSAITIGNTPAARNLVFIELRRITGNAGDTMAVSARLWEVTLSFTTNADTDA